VEQHRMVARVAADSHDLRVSCRVMPCVVAKTAHACMCVCVCRSIYYNIRRTLRRVGWEKMSSRME
jgi:hypothetical protein